MDENFIYVAIRSLTWFGLILIWFYRLIFKEPYDLSMWISFCALWITVFQMSHYFLPGIEECNKKLENMEVKIDELNNKIENLLDWLKNNENPWSKK